MKIRRPTKVIMSSIDAVSGSRRKPSFSVVVPKLSQSKFQKVRGVAPRVPRNAKIDKTKESDIAPMEQTFASARLLEKLRIAAATSGNNGISQSLSGPRVIRWLTSIHANDWFGRGSRY